MTDLPIKYRPMVDGDRGLIVTTWLKSYRASIPWLPRAEFHRRYRPVIHEILSRDAAWTVVACSPDSEEHVLGWTCGEPDRDRLHYLFVKSDYRRLGVGARLLNEGGVAGARATHWTKDGAGMGLCEDYSPDPMGE